jgi:flagellar hook-associated protein 2
MSTSGISFGGLASGLDTKAIIAALVAVEQRPITAMQQKKSALEKQKSLFGDLSGLLDKLKTAAKALSRTTDFLTMKSVASDATILDATAGNSAQVGSHDVVVHSLASSQVSRSGGFADKTTPVIAAAGTIFLNGTTMPVNIAAGSSLQDVADAINNAGHAVKASIVDTGAAGANRYTLVLRSSTLGSAGSFTLVNSTGPAAADIDRLVSDINANQVTAGTDASLTVDGIAVTRSSNSVADAIAGVTLELKAADVNKHVTVTVSTDSEATAKKASDFVDAYNAVVDFVTKQNALGADGKAQNPLFGDSALRSIRSGLRTIVGSTFATGSSAISMLAQVGITSDRDGKLTLDKTKFAAALASDETAVRTLFTDATSGIATRLQSQIDNYTNVQDGLIKSRRDGYDATIKNTQSRIEQATARLDRYQQQLQDRYARLETLLGKLQSQGNSLSSIRTN